MNLELEGQVAVIAGGAGAIGYASALRLARRGARVVLLGRASDDAHAKAAALPGAGHCAIEADLVSGAALVRAAEQVRERHGRADILVNSGGFTRPVPHASLDALDDELIDAIFAANWRAPFAAIRAFAPLLRESGRGVVVNVSSIAATTGIGSNVAYCAAKAGLDAMATSLGRALAPHIRVLNVSPGVVDSAFVPGRDASFNDKQAATTPLKRIGQPDDIAAAIEACATTLLFATGTVIQVDGGRHLGAA
ncbi:SDR family NAD(P)-dependent oxidoreductase [Pseudoduganella namucuonensis]|uniref:3-oxoacyl-[acyl-carrier protein] reductase n=1 Tax=Pseudoduganella namucuonensis TaxID=1035707 RepID=A0A1I7IHP7_9BURK|nr:SDR family oxidoreductase [Pseudoduganella namucuonensis]SFU72468.1 3-oxoacyl-[acyl-carrier protein] reductase [Pseudoduganella namucuonensis]